MVLHALLISFNVLQVLLQPYFLVLDRAFAEVEELEVVVVPRNPTTVVVTVR